MISSLSKKIAVGLSALAIAALSIFLISCQKELSGGGGFIVTETPPDLTTTIASSVSGFVTDETNAAVQGATVQFGASSTSTDKYGYFEFSNVQAVKTAAVVTVIKTGYFKGIKTYAATNGKSAFFRIKLLPKTTQGNFDAATGGTVTLVNGLAINFPGAAVKLATGGAYTGMVNVAAQWINPTATDLVNLMPGDLRGLDSLGLLKSLTTYGMAAVELTGGAGELLQVADGKKATLTFPIPASIAAAAPANIPLWSFNESNGLWEQEGHAVKNGSNYVGDVTHFSFWNCDVPNNFVQVNCTVKDADGSPVAGVLVKISVVSNPQNAAWGYTDSSGYVSGAVPNNAQLLLQVYSNYVCQTPLHSQNFTTGNQNVDLGNITIPSTAVATVTGNVIDCNAAAVANGYIIMVKDGYASRHEINPTGEFSITTPLCNATANVQLVAEDIDALVSSTPLNVTIAAGNNTVGTLSACGVSIEQFINYTKNGTNYSLAYPTDSFSHFVNLQAAPPLSYITGGTPNSGQQPNTVSFSFTQDNIAAGSTQTLLSFFDRQVSDTSQISGSPIVNITEYGAVGEFIAGNFTCTLTGAATYNINCSFRVRRNQ